VILSSIPWWLPVAAVVVDGGLWVFMRREQRAGRVMSSPVRIVRGSDRG
jgi:hypothetical protein